MKDHAGYPAYANTHVEYFPLGEDKFEALMRELKAARHFIFMEYFIVERGYMWDSILKVLEEKVKEGVEVRVMYDGMCCLMLLRTLSQGAGEEGNPLQNVFAYKANPVHLSE